MSANEPRPPIPGSAAHLAEILAASGLADQEIADLEGVLPALAAWRAPQPAPSDTRRLLEGLRRSSPRPSPVRQALARPLDASARALLVLQVAQGQVRVLGRDFWLLSAAVVAVGALLASASTPPTQALLLRAIGPLLAYLGTASAFRGAGLGALEAELATTTSTVRLVLARLVVVLAYDVLLGLVLSLVLELRFPGGAGGLLAVSLHWLAPLLLVAGGGLLLSAWLPLKLAVGAVYAAWLVAVGAWQLLLTLGSPSAAAVPAEALLSLLSAAMIVVALARLQSAVPRLLGG